MSIVGSAPPIIVRRDSSVFVRITAENDKPPTTLNITAPTTHGTIDHFIVESNTISPGGIQTAVYLATYTPTPGYVGPDQLGYTLTRPADLIYFEDTIPIAVTGDPDTPALDLGPLIHELAVDAARLHVDMGALGATIGDKITAEGGAIEAVIHDFTVNYFHIDMVQIRDALRSGLPPLVGMAAAINSLAAGFATTLPPALARIVAALEAQASADAPGPLPDITGSRISVPKLQTVLNLLGIPSADKINAMLLGGVAEATGETADFYRDIRDRFIVPLITTLVELLGQLVGEGMKALAPIEHPIVNVIAEQQAIFLREFKQTVLDPGISTPETALARATAGYAKATEFGMKAHMFSVLTELIHPTKHMGMSNLAASVADLADYGTLARAVIGSQIQEAIGEPMRQASNATARSRMPSEGQMEFWVDKRMMTPEDYKDQLKFFGWDEKWAKMAFTALFREPTLRDIALTLTDSDLDEGFVSEKVRKAGYSDEDAKAITPALIRKSTSAHRAGLLSSALTAYTNGVMSSEDLGAVMDVLDLRDDAQDLIRQRAAIQSRYDFVTEAKAVYEKEATNDQLSIDDLRVTLTALGIQPDRVDLSIQKVQATRLPRIAREEQAEVKAAIRQAQSLLLGRYRVLFLDGALSPDAYRDNLVAIGIDRELAVTVVHLDQLKLLSNASRAGSGAADIVIRKQLQLQEQALVELFRREEINRTQLETGLLGLGIPAGLADATVRIEATKRIPIRRVETLPPIEAKDKALAERQWTLAVIQFRGGFLDAEELKAALLATGEDPDLVAEDVAIEVARLASRSPAG